MLALLAGLALAEAPIDDDGRWQHAITLEPAALILPWSSTESIDFGAWGLDAQGRLVLVGSGDVVRVNADGVLDRDVFPDLEEAVYANDNLIIDDRGLSYCDREMGVGRVDHPGVLRPFAEEQGVFQSSCGLFNGDDTGVYGYAALTHTLAVFDNEGVAKQVVQIPGHIGLDEKKRLSTAPCGALADGTPLAMAADERFTRLQLRTLDQDLVYDKVLLDLDLSRRPERNALSVARAWEPRSCRWTADHLVLGLTYEVAVYDKEGQLESYLRNGAEFTSKSMPPPGDSAYAFDMVEFAGLLGDGSALAVVPFRNGMLKLYIPGEVDLSRPLALQKAGRHLYAHAAWDQRLDDNPENHDAWVHRARNMIEAGWYGRVVREYKRSNNLWTEQTDKALFQLTIEARARGVLRWLDRHLDKAPRPTLFVEAQPEVEIAETLAELAPFAEEFEEDLYLQQAVARLALVSHRRHLQMEALERLHAHHPDALTGSPEERWWLLSRGDAAGLRKAIGEDADPLWEARLIILERGAEGRTDAAHLLRTSESPWAKRMLAEIHADNGQFDTAISEYSTILANSPADDADARAALGATYLRRGLVELAVEQLVEARRIAPEDPNIAANLALAYESLDRRSDAEEVLVEARRLSGNDPVLDAMLAPPAEGGRKRAPLAVLPFDVVGTGGRIGLGPMFANMLQSDLVSSGAKVVERSRIDTVLAEQDLQRSTYVDRDTAVEAGRTIGAQRLVMGSVADLGDTFVLDVTVVEVKTGEISHSSRAIGELTPESIQRTTAGLAAELR